MGLRDDFKRQGTFLFRWRSYLPLLLAPLLLAALARSGGLGASGWSRSEAMYGAVCFIISLLGLAVRCAAVGFKPARTSGRGTALDAQALNSTGIYSVVRHPLYFGNFLVGLGLALFLEVWWFALFYVLAFALYYERIMFAEEEFLRERFGTEHDAWCARTPAFLPRLRSWVASALPFSVRAVLRREYSTLFLICAAFPVLAALRNLLQGRAPLSRPWAFVFAVGAAVYLILLFLKLKTKVLKVEGR